MFTKLDIKLKRHNVTTEEFRGDHLATYGYISYYKIKKAYMILPFELFRLMPERVTWTEVDAKANLPHRDYGIKTNINVYVDPADALTTFFSIKEGAEAWTPDPTQFYPNLYHHKDLEVYDTFKAQPYEAFLLDVTQVHEVSGIVGDPRKIIQLSWATKSYQEILDALNLT